MITEMQALRIKKNKQKFTTLYKLQQEKKKQLFS